MGFPVGYSELPSLILQMVLVFGHLRRLIYWACNSIGLADLLDPDAPCPNPPAAAPFWPLNLPPALIQDALPVLLFRDLSFATASCVVCLCEFDGADEIRRLSSCCHVFHRSCLDRWMEHHQLTCPICRSPLFRLDLEYDDYYPSSIPPSLPLVLPIESPGF